MSHPAIHDLLRIGGAADLHGDAPPPAWVEVALQRAPWVVVRRAPQSEARIAVGVRGSTRDQRFAAFVDRERVLECLSPAALRMRRRGSRMRSVPALATLEAIAPTLDLAGWCWGPAGSAGFELASGVDTVHERSDLDLVVDAPRPIPEAHARAIAVYLSRQRAVVDVRIETPAGAIALTELASGAQPILLRAAEGVRLVTDPWNEHALPCAR